MKLDMNNPRALATSLIEIASKKEKLSLVVISTDSPRPHHSLLVIDGIPHEISDPHLAELKLLIKIHNNSFCGACASLAEMVGKPTVFFSRQSIAGNISSKALKLK